MGYYTRYYLRFEPWPEAAGETHETRAVFLESLKLEDGWWSEWVLSYEYQDFLLLAEPSMACRPKDEIRYLSLRFQGCTIALVGEGEGHGDQWVLYARDGKTAEYRATPWTPPPLDPDDLT